MEPHVSRVQRVMHQVVIHVGQLQKSKGAPQMPPFQAFEALSRDHALIRPYLLGG